MVAIYESPKLLGDRFHLEQTFPNINYGTLAGRACDEETGRRVFVKALLLDSLNHPENAILSLAHKADILDDLDHEQIPRLIDAQMEGDTPFIATAWRPNYGNSQAQQT